MMRTYKTKVSEDRETELSNMSSKRYASGNQYRTESQVLVTTEDDNRFCNRSKISLLFELSLIVIGVGCIIQLFYVPTAVTEAYYDGVDQRLVMNAKKQKKNSSAFKRWTANTYSDSGKQVFSYYIMNVTNPEEVANGSYPRINEIGPYSFRRYVRRKGVIFDEDSCIVNYTTHFEYVFDEDLTPANLSLEDMVIIPNPPLFTYWYTMRLGLVLNSWPAYFSSLKGTDIFYNIPAKKALYGLADPELELNTWGAVRNITFWGLINPAIIEQSEYTGHCKKKQMRELIEMWNTTAIEWWDEPEHVNGSREPAQFPYDHLKKKDVLHVWLTPFFRSFKYHFVKTVKRQGLKLWRYQIDYTSFDNATNNPSNAKYFQNWYDGVNNITNRRETPGRAESYLSFGHFKYGDWFVEHISKPMGIRGPDNSSFGVDDIYMDIDPETGVVFYNYFSYMTALPIYPMDFVTFDNNFTKLPDVMIPIAYYTVEAYAKNSLLRAIKKQKDVLRNVQQASVYGGPVIGAICIAVAMALFCHRKKKDLIQEKLERFGEIPEDSDTDFNKYEQQYHKQSKEDDTPIMDNLDEHNKM